jgi:hypothetical protein
VQRNLEDEFDELDFGNSLNHVNSKKNISFDDDFDSFMNVGNTKPPLAPLNKPM